MEKITANNPLSKSANIIKENVETLKILFPTIVKEGKIDVDELKALLGEEVETSEEYYRFTWAGKSQARQEANKPSTGTLRPSKEESKDWDSTQNIFIEGDNLEVLKLLQKSYANKIKVIFIDPPYNTGKDFVYKDSYSDNLGNYLAITGQSDVDGRKFSTNTESDGRYHSNWLNMMYPRLKLARNLLKDDGAIFITIDDNEVFNLKKVCDEIFGENCFIANAIWRSKDNSNNDAKTFSTDHNHILIYAKSSNWQPAFISDESKQTHFKNPDNDPKGPYFDGNPLNSPNYRENLIYDLKTPRGKTIKPPKNGWRWSKELMQEKIKSGEIKFTEDESGIRRRTYLADMGGLPPSSLWIDLEKTGHNRQAKYELLKVLPEDVFDTPKPIKLLQYIIQLAKVDSGEIILDFFSGSGTTAHATMQLNAEDGKDRICINVQLPEPTSLDSEAFRAGYKTISEISKERIRRAGEKVKSEVKEELFTSQGKTLDIGFRVFKLDSSNINAWDGSVQNFEQNLFSAAENIKPDRTEEDVLYEILLKSGLDLAQPIEEKKIAGKKVFNIGLGALFICLANKLTTDIAEGIGKWKQEVEPSTCRVIFKDTGFNDVEKTNSIQILKRYGINEVNTI
jgi:adenine-specific DNA-methyltransferase